MIIAASLEKGSIFFKNKGFRLTVIEENKVEFR